MANLHIAQQTLKNTFGFDAFREGQQDAVGRLLDGRSVLAIFPTGAGKSMCYQLPALLLDGLTLVISPLIALMKDQIDFLTRCGVPAARLDSTLELEESRQIFSDLRQGKLKLLYIAPERLANERFLQTLRRHKLSMMAVDEAHCISEWGHNFRPDYLKLAALARDLKVGRVLALTATATPSVAQDITRAFHIDQNDVVQTGFHRPNLQLEISPIRADQRAAFLASKLRSRSAGPTIVYVTLQKTAEEIASMLEKQGFHAKAYHAGLDAELRHQVQDWFMASDDAIVVATIAFGMGIDKRNIRYVYHYNLPKTLENYAQEIGRAGRDGEPSICEMLAAAEDVIVLENFTYGDTPTPQAVESVVRDILGRGDEFDVSMYDLAGEHDIRPLVAETLLTYLELLGLIGTTGPFYNEYKFQPLTSSQQMLAKFDAARADFLRQVFKHATKAQIWWTIDISKVMETTGEPRNRIVSAINYLEEQGDLKLQVAGARQGYRMKKPAGDIKPLIDKLVSRFGDREQRDVARLKEVLKFAEYSGCRTRYLLGYFGEKLDGDCGHCGWCRDHRATHLPPARQRELGPSETDLLHRLRAETHAALKQPRQIARSLCGLPSPAATRQRLGKHEWFGALADVSFQRVLSFAESKV